jgi:hypothetical protein
MVQTLFMNMFFGGRLKGMPPKLASDDGRHIVIRPLAYVSEVDLERWAALRDFPIIPCTLCGNQDNLQRVKIRQMLRDWEREYPGRIENLFNAMAHVVPSHLLDRNLFPFETLQATGWPIPLAIGHSIQTRACEVRPGRAAGPAGFLSGGRNEIDPAAGGRIRARRCAAMRSIDSDVSTYSRWPPSASRRRYSFERLPSQQARAGTATATGRRSAQRGRGRRLCPAGDPNGADVTVQVGARVTAFDRSPFYDPFWWGPGPYWP